MAVVLSDIKQYLSENIPLDDVSASGGGISVVEFDDSHLNEFLPNITISPDDPIVYYYKYFVKNNNGSDTWYNVRFWGSNILLSPSASGTVAIVSSSTSDDGDYRVKLVGENSVGTETSEVVVLDGTTPAYSSKSFAKIHYAQFYDYTDEESPVIASPVGNITITRGIVLGIIPAGCTAAIGVVKIALDADIDVTTSVANRLTAPGGLTFYSANTFATALACTGAGNDIPAGSAQGIWVRVNFEAGVIASENLPLWISHYGASSE